MRRPDIVPLCAGVLAAASLALAPSASWAAPPDAGAMAKLDAGVSLTANGGGRDAGSAEAADAGAISALPAGHPPTPATDDDDPHGGDPRRMMALAGVFDPPEDSVRDDASLAPGTIVVELRDADDRPVPREAVSLKIMIQSVAKGESHRQEEQRTDDDGRAAFSHLETTSGVSYRVTCVKDAPFAAIPFNLPIEHGFRVVLHIYPVIHDLGESVLTDRRTNPPQARPGIVIATSLGAEIKDDRIQFEQQLVIYNLGRSAWVPRDLVVRLPDGFMALNSPQQMSDQGIDPVEGRGAKLHGTFPPTGVRTKHVVSFRWQLPWANDREVSFHLGLPPHSIRISAITPAAEGMKLIVDGDPAERPKPRPDLLAMEKDLTPSAAPSQIDVTLRDIPTSGNGKLVATGIAGVGVLLSLAFAFVHMSGRGTVRVGDPKRARAQLLADLEELERARAAGEVGPKTYERARRELIDAIARTLQKQP